MKHVAKYILLLAGIICLMFACHEYKDSKGQLRKSERDTLSSYDQIMGGGAEVGPAALRTIPGRSWRFWRLSDSTFALMSQDTSNNLESIIREDSLLAWINANASVTSADSQSLSIVSDSLYITRGNAVSLSAYFDTLRVSNDTLYISGQATGFYIGGGAGGGVTKKAATFIIASSTGAADSADFYCDGTADEVQIQFALESLPVEGGSILLREGQFNITANNIDVPTNAKIRIVGTTGTVVKVGNGLIGFSISNPIHAGFGQEEDLIIEGIRFENNTDDATAIFLESKHLATIQNCFFVGDSLTSIHMSKTNNSKILNNYFNKVKRGVYGVAGTLAEDDIEDITISGNDFSYVGLEAIYLVSSSALDQRDISNINIVANNIEEAGYHSKFNYAVKLENCLGAVITGNSITQTYRAGAIHLTGGKYNVITSNHFQQNGLFQQGGDNAYTMLIESGQNIISNNTIGALNVDYGIYINSGTGNRVFSNTIDLANSVAYVDNGTSTIIEYDEGGTRTIVSPQSNALSLQYDASTTGVALQMIAGQGGSAGVIGYSVGGTLESMTATPSDKFIALLSGRGHNGTTLGTAARGYIGVKSYGAWSGTNEGSNIQMATTPLNSTTPAVRMYIADDGDVTLGTGYPTASARLDITGTTGALLLPRLTTTQRNALAATNGMVIFNTTTVTFQGYNGAWIDL